MAVTHAEHMARRKARALQVLQDGNITGALASLCSDTRKHPETELLAEFALTGGLRHAGDVQAMRGWIEGFASAPVPDV